MNANSYENMHLLCICIKPLDMNTLSLSPLHFAFQLFLEGRDVRIYLTEIYSALIHIRKKNQRNHIDFSGIILDLP